MTCSGCGYALGICRCIRAFDPKNGCPECHKSHRTKHGAEKCDREARSDYGHMIIRGSDEKSPAYLQAKNRADVMKRYLESLA